jgi:hypothetical protein
LSRPCRSTPRSFASGPKAFRSICGQRHVSHRSNSCHSGCRSRKAAAHISYRFPLSKPLGLLLLQRLHLQRRRWPPACKERHVCVSLNGRIGHSLVQRRLIAPPELCGVGGLRVAPRRCTGCKAASFTTSATRPWSESCLQVDLHSVGSSSHSRYPAMYPALIYGTIYFEHCNESYNSLYGFTHL